MDLIEEIGAHVLNGESLYKIHLDYKCCAHELTDGRIPNCLTAKTKNAKGFTSFETFRRDMWTTHKIDVAIRCGEILSEKRDRLEEQMNAMSLTTKKTTKKVTAFAPKTSKKKTEKKVEAIVYEYYLDEETPCTKEEYDNAVKASEEAEAEEEAEEEY